MNRLLDQGSGAKEIKAQGCQRVWPGVMVGAGHPDVLVRCLRCEVSKTLVVLQFEFMLSAFARALLAAPDADKVRRDCE